MKTNLTTFALIAIITSSAFAALKAPMPEFKNEKQLAEWRAGKAAQATSQEYAKEDPAFYTGRPYLASSGSYAFKYRSYDPEMARWTSEDPSGFPDGVNGNIYVSNNPTGIFDYLGLTGKSALLVTMTNLFGLGNFVDGGFNYISDFNNQYTVNKSWMKSQDTETAGTNHETRYLSDGDIFDKHVVSSMNDLLSVGNGYGRVYIITHGQITGGTYEFMGPDGSYHTMSDIGGLNATMMTCYNAGAGPASGTGATGEVSWGLMLSSSIEKAITYLYE